MKNKLMISLGVATVFGLSVYIAWSVGYSQGSERTLGLQRDTIVGGTGALQDLRDGRIEDGTRTIENMVFSSAIILLESEHWRQNGTVQMFAEEIATYRRTYRADPNEWSVAEERLEELFTKQELGSQPNGAGNEDHHGGF